MIAFHYFREYLHDSEIFDSDSEANLKGDKSLSSKRSSWDLQSSFDKGSGSSSHPAKRKKTSPIRAKHKPTVHVESSEESNMFKLAPYPEFGETKVRGCLKNTGNHPGSSVQMLLKKKGSHPKSSTPDTDFLNSSKGKHQFSSSSSGFQLHPFLANVSLYFCRFMI